MKKDYFFGKYYKFVSLDGFSFAIIDSVANEGKMMQIITKDKSYFIKDVSKVNVKDDSISLNINEDDLVLKGEIIFGKLHPLSKNVMGPFSVFKMECKHSIYSMYHEVSGVILYNNNKYNFNNGYGYIEGDEGINFPKKYIWYNSVNRDYGLTLAIATIPFGLINFTGLLTFIKTKDKEYRMCTYNFGRIKEVNKDRIIIKKGKYILTINIKNEGGHMLKAPVKGDMNRYIKENLNVTTSFVFKKGNKSILENIDPFSSLEYMFD